MSKCAICHGSGSTACPECDGMGYTLLPPEKEDSEDLIRKLCEACHGRPLHTCHACAGSGIVDKAPAIVAPDIAAELADGHPRRPAQALPDRLAGKWKGVEGTWYEFVPDGDDSHYKATAGGPMGVSATGTARLLGHTVKLDATDRLLGHYELELTLRGDHLDGIDRKAGFPIPVVFSKA